MKKISMVVLLAVIIVITVTFDGCTLNSREDAKYEEVTTGGCLERQSDLYTALEATTLYVEETTTSFVDYLNKHKPDLSEEDTTEFKEDKEDNSAYDREYTRDNLQSVFGTDFSDSVIEQSMAIERDELLILNIVKNEADLAGVDVSNISIISGEESKDLAYYKVYLASDEYKWTVSIGEEAAYVKREDM